MFNEKNKMVPFTPTRTYTHTLTHAYSNTCKQHAERIRSSVRAQIPQLTRDTRKL